MDMEICVTYYEHMKNILVATDFTSASGTAVRFAARLALETNSKLMLFHATYIPVVSDSTFDITTTLTELESTDKEYMQAEVDKWKKKFGPELLITSAVKIGFPGELLREMVATGKVSVVVIGLSNSDKLSSLLFGSTATDIAGKLACPMIIVPDAVRYRPLQRLAFAFDQRPLPANNALKSMREIIAHFGSDVQFVNVQDEFYPSNDSKEVASALKFLKPASSGVHFLRPSTGNKFVEQLLQWTKKKRTQAIVLVAREHSMFWLMFHERTTKKLALLTKIPLIVLPEGK